MVTAGIYMVARTHAIFVESTTAMWVVATVGAFTALMAATIAITQNDIKRVVAYSTVSQLGYMAFALGTGAWIAAIFHLMTHAFFKGLLFLGSGSVIHGMHEEQNIQNMGGLRKQMPLTYWTFLIASLANAGVVPLAGFWSKDEIIVGAWISDVLPAWGNLISIVGLVAAFLTALYMFRLVFLTFFTQPRYDTAHVHPHESPSVMTVPLLLLAVPSAIIGFVGFPPEDGPLQHFLEPVFFSEAEGEEPAETASLYTVSDDQSESVALAQEEEHAEEEEHAAGPHHVSTAMTVTFGVISTVVALGGIFVAYLTYITGRISAVKVAARWHGLYTFLYNKWYFDELYDRWIVQPAKWLADTLWRVVDVGIIDGTVNGVAGLIGAASQRVRHVQTGLVANYALAIALGMVVIVGVYLAAFSDLFR
jgi:NADH-quinone oxidoreductase subunit L